MWYWMENGPVVNEDGMAGTLICGRIVLSEVIVTSKGIGSIFMIHIAESWNDELLRVEETARALHSIRHLGILVGELLIGECVAGACKLVALRFLLILHLR